MGLEDDLKARTSALISQQMATWVVEIQRAIQGHQAALVQALDELGETVARYDEKVDEVAIASAVEEVLATQAPAQQADYSGLKESIAAIEKGGNLSEVLTHLVTQVTKTIDHAAMFIIKNNAAVGWYAKGFDHAETIKTLSVPLTADTLFRTVSTSRQATRAHVSQSPGTARALSRLGGNVQGILAVPLILRDKVAAVLYCDTSEDEVPQATADLIEVLVAFAGKVIDVLSAAARQSGAGTGTTPTGPGARPPVAAAPAPEPEPAIPAWGAGTVRPQAASRPPTSPPGRLQAPASMPAPRPAPPTPRPAPAAARGLSAEDQKAHDEAKRFARLVVSEIKLYNEAKVTEGRRTKDIYERLKEDIERGRQMYHDRVAPGIRDATDYFQDELVRILAGGDASALGPV